MTFFCSSCVCLSENPIILDLTTYVNVKIIKICALSKVVGRSHYITLQHYLTNSLTVDLKIIELAVYSGFMSKNWGQLYWTDFLYVVIFTFTSPLLWVKYLTKHIKYKRMCVCVWVDSLDLGQSLNTGDVLCTIYFLFIYRICCIYNS